MRDRKALVTDGWTPREVYDQAETNLKVARQHVASIEQQIANTVAALDGDPNIEIDRHPTVRAAKAQLDRARLDLSYATVTAPDDGIVTRVDDLQVGDFVNPGAAVFSMMSSRRIWIEANFRETGLTHMRPGQEATINVDAYPDRTFKAHVVSMSPGTGSDFAVLPPENATGNWVKVVQRLPVRLELDEIDPNRPLFSGISVTVRVDTGYRRTWRHPLQAVLRDGGGQMSAALASSTAADGHRAIIVAALMATYMQAVTISLPNAALLLYPGHAVDGRRRGRLDIYLVYRGERRHHADDALACGPLRPKGRFIRFRSPSSRSALCSRRVRRPRCNSCRPDRPRWRKRHPRSAVDGDPARYAAALAARPYQPGGGRDLAARHPAAVPASAAGSANITAGARCSMSACRWRASSSWRWRSRFRRSGPSRTRPSTSSAWRHSRSA